MLRSFSSFFAAGDSRFQRRDVRHKRLGFPQATRTRRMPRLLIVVQLRDTETRKHGAVGISTLKN
ncbi:MAG: hypothetical protein F6K58_06980 [Symploca sp. SIO2E9]|nr:hypothetical protein [Symploca sp. SIO2E9]